MLRFFPNAKRSLDSLLILITDLVTDGLRFFRLLFRSRAALSAEVLFLRKQLASWAGICPGNNESGGKRKSSRIPKGNVYLKTALVEAANAAAKAKGTYLRDNFCRLKARRVCVGLGSPPASLR